MQGEIDLRQARIDVNRDLEAQVKELKEQLKLSQNTVAEQQKLLG